MGFLAISLALLAMILQLTIVFPTTKADANEQSALLDFLTLAYPSNTIPLATPHTRNINDYCQWNGVICDKNKSVVVLELPNVGLNGTILQGLFSRLNKLRRLSLRHNKLKGIIPPLSQAIYLQDLLLDDNELSGPIPNSLANLTSLKIINISNNHLSGNLPDSPIFSSLISFDVSNNNLSGPIPFSLSHFDKSSFEGNSLLCGQLLLATCPTPKVLTNKIVAVYASRGVGIVGSLFALTLLCFRRKKTQEIFVKQSPRIYQGSKKSNSPPSPTRSNFSSNVKGTRKSLESTRKKDAVSTNEPKNELEISRESIGEKENLEFIDNEDRQFGLEDLLKGSAQILGHGLLGSSYKATLEGGLEVVVKRLTLINHCCDKDAFLEIMKAIARANHPNIMPLRAHFFGKEEKLLIYDYMPHGSLFNALHSEEGRLHTPLDWISRIRIAKGVASALDYIHTAYASSLTPSRSPMCNRKRYLNLHGNIKSSNILLGPNMEAYVADFGMAPMLANVAAQSYMASQRAPECRSGSKKLVPSVDVYSYGVLLLELLTGKMPMQAFNMGGGQGVDLPSWVESMIREEWTGEVFDHELAYNKVEEDELVSLLKLAMACLSPHLDQRPSMAQALQTIQNDIKSFQPYESDTNLSLQNSFASLDHGYGASFHHSLQHAHPHHPCQIRSDVPSSDHFSFSFDDPISRLSSVDSFRR